MRAALFLLIPTIVIAGALIIPVFLPRAEGPPNLRESAGYVTNTEIAVFDGSRADVLEFLRSEEGNILDFTDTTDRIPAISSTTVLSGNFPDQVGAVRQIDFDTGDKVVERVLAFSDDNFAYQVWGFSAAAARPIDHIRGEFNYIELGDGRTQVVWTYAVAPRIFWARPFIRGFLSNDFAPFMESGLQGAATAFNGREN